jgi:hypothetical protein
VSQIAERMSQGERTPRQSATAVAQSGIVARQLEVAEPIPEQAYCQASAGVRQIESVRANRNRARRGGNDVEA